MKRFFYITHSDRRVVTALLLLLVIIAGIVIYVGTDGREAVVTDSQAVTDTARAVYKKTRDGRQIIIYDEGRRTVELFPFDPNTADSTQLLRLGLSKWQVRSIYRYRNAGGIYKHKEQFANLRGLTIGQYRQLEPYIRISEDYRPAHESVASVPKDEFYRDTLRYPLKLKEGQYVALNTADTTQLKRIPGIGSGFAGAIVRYRERLGGFYSVSQLQEIEGFPDNALKFFKADGEPYKHLNVNELPLSKLRRHPYIGFYRAKTIVEHRRIHGKIKSLSELGMYADFPQEVIAMLSHYVEY